jgi:hypothetical protein
MKKLLAVAATLCAFTACEKSDPTQSHDFRCNGPDFGTGADKAPACVQFRITYADALLAETVCTEKSGVWAEQACPSENRVPGTCNVDSAGDYSLSGKPAKVYFYSPVIEATADAACTAGGATWIPAL